MPYPSWIRGRQKKKGRKAKLGAEMQNGAIKRDELPKGSGHRGSTDRRVLIFRANKGLSFASTSYNAAEGTGKRGKNTVFIKENWESILDFQQVARLTTPTSPQGSDLKQHAYGRAKAPRLRNHFTRDGKRQLKLKEDPLVNKPHESSTCATYPPRRHPGNLKAASPVAPLLFGLCCSSGAEGIATGNAATFVECYQRTT